MTINEQILECFNRHFDRWDGDEQAAAKELQLLFLQSQLDLLNECNVILRSIHISDKISELTQQINNLNH